VPVEPKVRKVKTLTTHPRAKPDTYVQELEGKVKEATRDVERITQVPVGTGTPYVLGLAPDASMEEAKARYKVLMRF